MPYTDLPSRRSTLDRRAQRPGGLPTNPPAARTPARVRFVDGPVYESPDEFGDAERTRASSLPTPQAFYAADPREVQSTSAMQDPPRDKKRVRFSADTRCDSEDSEDTLLDADTRSNDDMSQYSLSSYRHPYDIPAPPTAHGGRAAPAPKPKFRASFEDDEDLDEDLDEDVKAVLRRYRPCTEDAAQAKRKWDNIRNMNLLLQYGDGSPIFDPDDPVITGVRKETIGDVRRDEKERLRLMSYRQRRKHLQRARIEYNVTTMQNRQDFLLVLGKALVKYAAPSHRLESQLLAAARILEVELQTVHLPTTIIASFGNDSDGTSEVHVLCRKSQLALGALHRVHQIYRAVVHDEVSAKEAMRKLDSMLQEPPIYGPRAKLVLSFCLSALICPLAFGGSFVDMWLAGVGAFSLCFVQTYVSSKSGTIYANVWDTTVTVGISFAARGLSSIRSQVFCYSAISSSAIIGILPGFLVLCSALELGSKNLVCGSVNLVYALIVTLFISFGLEIGSELFLLFDPHAHTEVTTLAARAASAVTITGTYIADPNTGSTLSGAFSFTNSTPIVVQNIVINCYRPPEFPWYLQPFPWWTQFFLVPLFALLCSLANQQPLLSWDLIVMVFISCVGYAANKIASMFIFNHSDIVSAIGAFAIGLLGNIYSRMLGGTAFTVMVPGVLFLVPSGLSQAGGINGQGDNGGIDTGYAMVEVVVGIVVGLFISQALVYILGNRKNAASFTF